MFLIAHELTDSAWQWTWDPLVVAGLLVSAALYARGLARIRREGRGPRVRAWEPVCFALGWLAIVAALVSPVDALSEQLFAVHMVQHELLMIVAAPLLVLGRPLVVGLWAFTPAVRDCLGRLPHRTHLHAWWRAATAPLVAWLLHGAALWVWHLPALYEAALADERIHAFEHLCFFGTAAVFWSALAHGRYRRLGYGVSVAWVFTTALHGTLLGALLTLAPRAWYPAYADGAHAWGLSLLEDQQLAGLVMWVPAGIVITLLGLALFAAWIGESERRVVYSQSERLARSANGSGLKAEGSRPDRAEGSLAEGSRPALRTVLVPVLLVLLTACTHQPSSAAAALTGGDPERGKETFRKYGCVSCHTIPGVPGADALVGPPLTQMGARAYIAGRLPNTPDNMLQWLQHPQQVVPGNVMPDMSVGDQDARDMAAYLYTLR
jgi:cytochrome c oxidase assembly factor CtaG/cytochrome c2